MILGLELFQLIVLVALFLLGYEVGKQREYRKACRTFWWAIPIAKRLSLMEPGETCKVTLTWDRETGKLRVDVANSTGGTNGVQSGS